MSALDIGVTHIKQGENAKCFTTMGGVLQFKDDECIILTTTAECGDDIDVARAKDVRRNAWRIKMSQLMQNVQKLLLLEQWQD